MKFLYYNWQCLIILTTALLCAVWISKNFTSVSCTFKKVGSGIKLPDMRLLVKTLFFLAF